jgi:hypothetical protein
MRRTRFLLIGLTLLIIVLAGVRWLVVKSPSPDLAQLTFPSITPVLTPTIVIPEPTITRQSDYQTYISSGGIFSLIYPDNWNIIKIRDSSIDSWELSVTEGSASAVFDFILTEASQSGAGNSITCGNDSTCQIVPIGGVDYQVTLELAQGQTINIDYQALFGSYSLSVSGIFSGNESDMAELIDTWDSISQSFAWKE